MSSYFEHHRDAYVDHMLAVSQRGEWTPWIRFFLQGVIDQCEDALGRAKCILSLRDKYKKKMENATGRVHKLRAWPRIPAHRERPSKRQFELRADPRSGHPAIAGFILAKRQAARMVATPVLMWHFESRSSRCITLQESPMSIDGREGR
jgi:hypothetical protein